METLKLYEHDVFGKLRIYWIDGEPFFPMIDVSNCLHYTLISLKRNAAKENWFSLHKRVNGYFMKGFMHVFNLQGLEAAAFRAQNRGGEGFLKWVREIIRNEPKENLLNKEFAPYEKTDKCDLARRLVEELTFIQWLNVSDLITQAYKNKQNMVTLDTADTIDINFEDVMD